jgi:hypothetical protein
MRAPGSFEHQAGETPDRNVGPDAVLINDDKSPVEYIDIALLDENNRRAILQRDRPWGRQARKGNATHLGDRRNSINPRPKALPRPKPVAILATNTVGSRTVSVPSNSMTASLNAFLPLSRIVQGS